MPKNFDWEKTLNKTWYWSKVILALIILTLLSYGYGTFHPNKHAKLKVNSEQFIIEWVVSIISLKVQKLIFASVQIGNIKFKIIQTLEKHKLKTYNIEVV